MVVDAKSISLITISLTALSAMFGIFVYIRQQRLNHLQNLVSVFQRFSNNDDFIRIFSISDSCYVRLNDFGKQSELLSFKEQLTDISTDKKFKYLALLEEVAILAKNSIIINANALHLFKFHFYYVYGVHEISTAFWSNVGSGIDEKTQKGWAYQSDFAKKCIIEVKK